MWGRELSIVCVVMKTYVSEKCFSKAFDDQ